MPVRSELKIYFHDRPFHSAFLRKTTKCLRVYHAPYSPQRHDVRQKVYHCPLSEFRDEPCPPHHMLQLNRATLPGWRVLYSLRLLDQYK